MVTAGTQPSNQSCNKQITMMGAVRGRMGVGEKEEENCKIIPLVPYHVLLYLLFCSTQPEKPC
jgi:hypothetical protein